MALPALSKTYHAHANLAFADTSTTALIGKSFFWALKALLNNAAGLGGTQSGTRSAQSVWAHVASCDGTSVSTVTDLWTNTFDASKLVPNGSGSAHSWWKGTNGTHDIVIDMNSATAGTGRIALAPTGLFSAGSTTLGPIASTDFVSGSTTNNSTSVAVAYLTDTAATGSNMRAHLVTNASDFSFQFHTSRVGQNCFNAFVSLQKTTGANDSYNNFFFNERVSSGRGSPSIAIAGTSACIGRTCGNASVKSTGGMAYLQSAGTTMAGVYGTDALTGDYWADPCEIRDLTTGYIAKRGFVADWYAVGSAAVGSSVPSAAAQERIVCGDFVMPFPSVVPSI